eukprot:PhF_6_TR27884/c0_g1_i1/m.40831/K07407/E3.2.1.22B, galA, rafA; alpha-galactosidase
MFLLLLASLLAGSDAWDVAGTPPMGFNTWNLFACGVDADVLINTAKAMVSTGLSQVGYEYINSDDCWMLADRDANGNQVANPAKFPYGFQNVTAFIHSLGLKSGLYTAKGTTTCAGFAASCDHEEQDAKQWASWGIDYVKDDDCSACGNYTYNELYHRMWQAIQDSGRSMVLTVEGQPDDALITNGGYGNAKRVGHDIMPHWMSMVSLVDIGSGLWSYAHNSTNPQYGGWWNDLDMIEIGNAPDFLCGESVEATRRCQAHFTMWTIMKAPLILGNDLTKMDLATFSTLSNQDAIGVNQDALGVQARRVSVQLPRNNTLGGDDSIAVIAPCDECIPTQTWKLIPSQESYNILTVAPCNATDPLQQWTFFPNGFIMNQFTSECIDSSTNQDPVLTAECSLSSRSQMWTRDPNGHIRGVNTSQCIDVDGGSGPNVDIWGCKTANDANQQWSSTSFGGIKSASSGTCLSLAKNSPGYTIVTTDPTSQRLLCIVNKYGDGEGTWQAVPCNPPKLTFQIIPVNNGTKGKQQYNVVSPAGAMRYNNQVGASGPWPHTRYLNHDNYWVWILDLEAGLSSRGTTIEAINSSSIIDDDLVGGATRGGSYCLDVTTGGMLEVWAGPLTQGRIAVSLWNRSPSMDKVVARWEDIGVVGGVNVTYSVFNVWNKTKEGVFRGKFEKTLHSREAGYFILTPEI